MKKKILTALLICLSCFVTTQVVEGQTTEASSVGRILEEIPAVTRAMDKAIESFSLITDQHKLTLLTEEGLCGLNGECELENQGSQKEEVLALLEEENTYDDLAESEDGSMVSLLYVSDQENPITGELDEAQLLLYFNDDQLFSLSIANRTSEIEAAGLFVGDDFSQLAHDQVDLEDLIAKQSPLVALLQVNYNNQDTLVLNFMAGDGPTILSVESYLVNEEGVIKHGSLPASHSLSYIQSTQYSLLSSLYYDDIEVGEASHPLDEIISTESFPNVSLLDDEDLTYSENTWTAWENFKAIAALDKFNNKEDKYGISFYEILMLLDPPALPFATTINDNLTSLNYHITDGYMDQADLQLVFDYGELAYLGFANLGYSYQPQESDVYDLDDFQEIRVGSKLSDLAQIETAIQAVAQTYYNGDLYYQIIIPYRDGQTEMAGIIILQEDEVVNLESQDFAQAQMYFQNTMMDAFTNYFSRISQ